MKIYNLVLIFIHSVCVFTNGARILGIVPTPSYSHQIVFRPLWKELSLRGHQVTVITSDPVNDPKLTNLTEIDVHFTYDIWNRDLKRMIESQGDFFKQVNIMVDALNEITDQELSHPEVQDLIRNKSEHFDLLMMEFLMPTMAAFSERFKCPIIGVTSLDAPTYAYGLVGNPAHPVLNPDLSLSLVGKLTFFDRLISVAYKVLELQSPYLETANYMIRRHFGNHFPSVHELMTNINMLFVNADPIFHPIRPLVPAVVQIGGGTHRDPSKPLPKDLQTYLDNATEGFIYFSLGSNVKSKYLSETKLNIIMETFSELPYKVLWKFELDDLPGKPDNVLISKWFPQQDILNHPNIKLFITQGGIQSIDEAIYSHVPMIGIPFFVDQPGNIKRMVDKGMGLSLDHETLSKKELNHTILEVINNSKYKNRIIELATLAQDQPMTGIEKAVWWTEYVLRHKGANHLRGPALNLPFYQYYLLDVIGFFLLVAIVFAYAIYKSTKLAYNLVYRIILRFKVKLD